MHVGLDLVFLLPRETGGRETYARELVRALAAGRPDLRFTSFVGREAGGEADGFWRDVGAVVTLGLSPRSRGQWALAELAAVPAAAARAHVDVLHSLANFGPLAGPFARVLTVHDLGFRHCPELLPRSARLGTELLVPAATRRAHRVVTVSRASRDDLVRELGIPAARVDVVPNGVGLTGARKGNPTAGRERVGAGSRPIALSVAADLPHKNLGVLIDALALHPPPGRPLLVLAGPGTDRGELQARAERLGVAADVRAIGGVSAEDLEDLYAAAALVVATSRYEGFGLPVLEAMARGIPVACSDIPALREVAGEAAVFLDAGDPSSVAAALRRLLQGGAAVDRLRSAGRDRAARFSWERAAEATAESYLRALRSRLG